MIAAATLRLVALLPLASAPARQDGDTARICLAPASAEVASGNTTQAVTAVGETFTSFLTGPSLGVTPLTARLESQAREEARAAGCPHLLFTTLKHVHKRSGGGVLGRVAAGAVETGAWMATGTANSAAVRAATGTAVGSLGVTAREMAASVKVKDELTLAYRLEAADGRVLAENREKRKASSDGEDLLTPLVEHAAKTIAAAVAGPSR